MVKESRLNWFGRLREAQFARITQDFEMLAELEISHDMYVRIKNATDRYVRACLKYTSARDDLDELTESLQRQVDELANRTPNGILMPKLEFEEEFNDLHRSLAGYIRSLNIDDTIYVMSSPIIVRIVKGDSEPDLDQRPFASTKIHMDPWSGDPGDEVVVSIPILGDIANTTVQYFKPPRDDSSQIVRTMSDYEEGQRAMGKSESVALEQKIGYAYFMDAIVPHRTIKNGGGIRVTLEFRLRRLTSEEERIECEASCDPGRLSHFVDVIDWYSLGSTRRMKFIDTYEDARNGIFIQRPYNEPIYNVVDIPPEMFD